MIISSEAGVSSRSDSVEQIRISKGKVHAHLKLYGIVEGDHFILYSPSLRLSGYGANKEEASEMLRETMDDYLGTILTYSQKRFEAELNKYGFFRDKTHKKNFHSTVSVDKRGILKDFDLPEDSHIEEEMLTL